MFVIAMTDGVIMGAVSRAAHLGRVRRCGLDAVSIHHNATTSISRSPPQPVRSSRSSREEDVGAEAGWLFGPAEAAARRIFEREIFLLSDVTQEAAQIATVVWGKPMDNTTRKMLNRIASLNADALLRIGRLDDEASAAGRGASGGRGKETDQRAGRFS